MTLRASNHIFGISGLAKQTSFESLQSSERLSSTKKLASDDIVGYIVGNNLSDQGKFNHALLKSINSGFNILNTANSGLERIHNLLVTNISIAASAISQSDDRAEVLNKEFLSNLTTIDNIAKNTKFGDLKLLDGSYGISRSKELYNAENVSAISIASKSAPIGPNKFLRDNIAFQPFEASASMLTVNGVQEGDYVIIDDVKFIFTKDISKNKEIFNTDIYVEILDTDEATARRFITTLLNQETPQLQKYAAASVGGGIVTVQSQIRSGDAVFLSSSNNIRLSVDNISAKADENVLNLNNLIDNIAFAGKVSPDFNVDAASISTGAAARLLASNAGINLLGYAGDNGDSAAKYTCKIGDKTYSGVLFIRGIAGSVVNLATGSAGAEKGFLVMREDGNEDSSFTVNFDQLYTGRLDNAANAGIIANDINELFSRIDFRQNRALEVNEISDSKAKRLFDAKTTTATITGTNFDNLEVEDFRIYNYNETRVIFEITINGMKYTDNTVSKNLREGDRLSLEIGNNDFISITIGKGGLDLYDPSNLKEAEKAFMTFFTSEEQYLDIRVGKNSDDYITTKILDFRINRLLKGDGEESIGDLNIIDGAGVDIAIDILERARLEVLDQMATISTSINTVTKEISRINSSIGVMNNAFNLFTNIDLVKEAANFTKQIKLISAVIASQSGMRLVNNSVAEMVASLSK